MERKRMLYMVLGSVGIMVVLMLLIYGFELSLMNISNVCFLVGMVLFFGGLISVSGAGEVLDSSAYLTRRVFNKNSDNEFKTFGEYKAYKKLRSATHHVKNKGFYNMVLGGVYVVISLAISF